MSVTYPRGFQAAGVTAGFKFAERARAQMEGPEVAIHVRLGDGAGSSRVFGCDLTYDYVRINGEYTT